MTAIASGLVLGGRYALTERIAVGGMGEVWRATDTKLGRPVAVKLLKPEYADDRTFLERFRAEGRHAAMLSHPGIASVFDYGEVDGASYLVMELVDGEPLSHLLAREAPLDVERTLDIIGQVALALQAAHEAGVVHRDVKPGNILVRPDGVVKVTDFGIARAVDAAPVTQTGLVLGTAHYLSPEQSRAGRVTAASDVYSLGIVAYECLTGRRPFTGDNLISVVNAHATEPPPPLPGDVPAPVALLVMQALDKEPARRPESAGSFGRTALALLAAMRGAPTGAATEAAATPTPIDVQPPPAARLEHTRAYTGLVAGAAPGSPRRGRRLELSGTAQERRRTGLVFAGIALVAIAVAALVLKACAPGSAAKSPAASTASAQHARTTSTARTVAVNADDYLGKPYDQARAALSRLGLVVRRSDTASGRTAGSVASVAPTGNLPVGSTVVLGVAAATQPPPSTPANAPGNSGKHHGHKKGSKKGMGDGGHG